MPVFFFIFFEFSPCSTMIAEYYITALNQKSKWKSETDMEKNLTSGSVFKTTLLFSLPFLLSYFLQTLYGMADLFIIGQYDGTASITAVAIGSQIMHMLTVMIVGLGMGTTVAVGRAVGERRNDKAADAIGNTVVIFLGGSLVLTVLLLSVVRPLVALLSTPAEAVAGTVQYLVICFAGIPFITAYNVISSIYRGLGDSRSPMYFVAVACVVNIALDYLFIGWLGLGPAGAALGTTLSQAVSVGVALAAVVRHRGDGLVFSRKNFRMRAEVSGPILRVGIPISLQDGFIQVAFIVITIIANMRGLNDAAAVGIVEKVICLLFLVPSAMLASVSALASQNIGADRYDRARRTLLYGILISAGYGAVIAVLSQFYAPEILRMFEDNPAVIRLGSQYLRGYVWDGILVGIHFCFSGYFCACEHSGISFLHNALSIVLVRIPGSWLGSHLFADTLLPMGLAAPAGSLLSVIICVIAYVILLHRDRKTVEG